MQSRRRFICGCLGAMAGCSVFPKLAPAKLVDILPPSDPVDGKTFRVICFHDVRDNLLSSFNSQNMIDPYAVDTGTLTSIFSWLQYNSYHPITVKDVEASRSGGKPLPPRAVMLTFDDGFRSHYTKVLPLLERFRFPAVMGIVTSWVDTPPNQKIRLAINLEVPRDTFMSWDEVGQVAKSPLVELASHTHDLHHGAIANPQGNELPAATSHLYLQDQKRYETDEEFEARVQNDLAGSIRRLHDHAGVSVRSMVWPYGAENQPVRKISQSLGMHTQFSLEAGPNTPDVPLDRLRRILMTYDVDVGGFERSMREPATNRGQINPVERVVRVHLDDVYDPDGSVQEKKLGDLIQRIYDMRPSSVYLQAYSDPNNTGVAEALYFPNRHLPMRADLFSRAAWQLNTRSQVQVYAWMPLLAFRLPADQAGRIEQVTAAAGAPADRRAAKMYRLSPFDPAAHAMIREIYEDLGKYSAFTGLLFGGDALLDDYEDAGRHAAQTFQRWGLPADIGAIRANPELMTRWTVGKTKYLVDLSLEVEKIVLDSQNGGDVLTIRDLYADVLLDRTAEARFSQSYDAFLRAYDFVALLAMPGGERYGSINSRLDSLADITATTPNGLRQTVYQLPVVDPQTGETIPSERLLDEMRHLRQRGVVNFGYYPDRFAADVPKMVTMRDVMSLRARLDPTSINALLQAQQQKGVTR
ncbi:poly-beta-1,6-N-acetyl-D-glucosamine N-deacetylase PgaB [Paraburkholderia humisilvae]|uniref:Poly-beta-1,6-N-acetyl-D-glucosamine N-deacetylase n=1 Tax=Paraburkholderia humisilvae TaxID=627669 RepID=A0A6J5D691_9BURK|nr:poly-beta-1,6-N-acetyl-D-glucosamine N-deacetylase PgaB [Paraburkholderia humisilvae]CAB3748722.1 Poly-beta-1,6-N-acetyl-D-glucosamine N-deacetylase [Paraburkholderia humisilvae]